MKKETKITFLSQQKRKESQLPKIKSKTHTFSISFCCQFRDDLSTASLVQRTRMRVLGGVIDGGLRARGKREREIKIVKRNNGIKQRKRERAEKEMQPPCELLQFDSHRESGRRSLFDVDGWMARRERQRRRRSKDERARKRFFKRRNGRQDGNKKNEPFLKQTCTTSPIFLAPTQQRNPKDMVSHVISS